MSHRKTAGELAHTAKQDTTNYNVLELAHAVLHDVEEQIYESIRLHKDAIEQKEFCVVRIVATDNLIAGVKRIKYYCWPYLPKPRPDQTVFLYNKDLDKITKRLWSLPSAARMAQLASTSTFVPEEYRLMQAWSVAFFKGRFWEFVRYHSNIKMLSEHEYVLESNKEFIKNGGKRPDSFDPEPFDFSKIHIEKIIDTQEAIAQ